VIDDGTKLLTVNKEAEMKQLKVTIVVVLAVFFSSVLFSSLAFAKAYSQPPGEPPYGLKVEGAAGGTKLYGTLTLEEYGFASDGKSNTFTNAVIVLRLRQGNDIQLFYGTISGSFDQTLPADIQAAVIQAMKSQILDYFFGGDTSLTITLKNVTDFVFTDNGASSLGSYIGYVMMDVELAVK
jgi:hypothetical protein